MTDPGTTAASSPTTPETEFRTGVQRIRGALTELYISVGADPSAPQLVSRQVGINRNLAWKLSKIIGAEEPLATIEHLPGGSGLEIMLKAFEGAGAPRSATEHVRRSMDEFERAVADHIGDRETLELMLAHMLPLHLQIERAEAARRLAFRGNSATWGIQASVRLFTMLAAPNPEDPTLVDLASVGGLIGYRRLRRGSSWPLLRVRGYHDDGTTIHPQREPLDPTVKAGAPPLLTKFCTGAQPELRTRHVAGGVQFEVGDGPLGNQGRFTSIFGTISRRFGPCHRDAANDRGEQMIGWFMPVETAISDLIVHRALPFELPPSLELYGRLTTSWDETIPVREGERLHVPESIQHLGEGPPVLATPVIPEYATLMSDVFERLGWDPRDFCAYRLIVRYPPIPSVAILSFALGDPPA